MTLITPEEAVNTVQKRQKNLLLYVAIVCSILTLSVYLVSLDGKQTGEEVAAGNSDSIAGCLRTASDRYSIASALTAQARVAAIAADEPGISQRLRDARRDLAEVTKASAADISERTAATPELRLAFCEAQFPSK